MARGEDGTDRLNASLRVLYVWTAPRVLGADREDSRERPKTVELGISFTADVEELMNALVERASADDAVPLTKRIVFGDPRRPSYSR